ncbi:MAG: hypothetical protein VYB61_04360 [Verrucomicrobiota bacterium]|nr:hypothetical protein [Verrucomicrobiota bacterium]
MKMLSKVILVFVLCAGSLSAKDIVHFQSGPALHGEILELDAVRLRIRVPLAGGAGNSMRVIPMERVRMIDFDPAQDELKLLADGVNAPRNALKELWESKQTYLGLPNSNAGQIGIQLAGIYLAGNSSDDHSKAGSLYEIIEQGDWNKKRKSLAKRGRLQALVKLGKAEDVIEEATRMAAEHDDPGLLLDARHVLALSDYEKLSRMVEENPKWIEDETVRGEIEEKYHALVDGFLEPFLFYGTETVAASRGLWHAAKTYQLTGKVARALECLGDLEKLYPGMGDTYPMDELRKELSIKK